MNILSLGFGFYRIVVDSRSIWVPGIARGKMIDWRFGYKCVGYTRNGTPLSDGSICTEVDGIPWVETKPSELGFIVDIKTLSELIFHTNKPRLKFVGTTLEKGWGGGKRCPDAIWVANDDVNKESLPDQGGTQLSLSVEAKDVLPLLSQGRLGGGRLWISPNGFRFRPTKKMDEDVARSLGYCALNMTMNVPVNGDGGIVLPFGSLAEAELHGFKVKFAMWCNGRQMGVSEALVLDRKKAVAVLPCLASFPNASCVKSSIIEVDGILVKESDLEGVQVTGVIAARYGVNGWWVPLESKVKGLTHVLYSDKVVLSDSSLTKHALVSVAEAARSWVVKGKITRYSVWEDGKELCGKFVLRKDLAQCQTRQNWKMELNKRRKIWMVRFGGTMPKDWHLKSDEELERALLYRQRLSQGWVVHPMFGLNDLTLIEQVRVWMQDIEGLTVEDPFTDEIAYRHDSLDAFLESTLVLDLLKELAGPAYGFMCRAFQRESVQMAVLADSLAA